MTDKTLSAYGYDLPLCPLTTHCLRLVDDLDGRDPAYWPAIDMADADSRDMMLLEQLRAHVQYCPTCSAALRRVRKMRSQQRRILRGMLAEGEQKVPSTTDHTLKAIRREPAPAQKGQAVTRGIEQAATDSARQMLEPGREDSRRVSHRSSRLFQGVLSVVIAAALIIASLSLFSHLVLLHSHSVGGTTASSLVEAPAPAAGWSSVAMTFVRNDGLMVVNEDPARNQSVVMASKLPARGADLDSISHDGLRLLYSVYNGKQTEYTFQPQAPGHALYTFPNRAGHTVWSADDRYVFISTPQGVKQVDARSSTVVRVILPSSQSPDIRFYYGGYLYYLVSNNGIMGILDRVNIADGAANPVTTCPQGRDFWLSPSGTTIYYVCSDQNALYAANTDGTNAHIVRSNAGWLIGYAADNSLLMLRNVGTRYQVVKLGTTPAQDRVLLEGLAPKSAYIAPDSVAVAPYGRALVANAIYADGHEELWYADLTASTQRQLSVPAGATLVALKGWDRLQVPGAALPTPTASQSFLPSS